MLATSKRYAPPPLHQIGRDLRKQSGIIVVFTLIAVVLLMIASVALVRSFDTSLVVAGNMAFKRDLLNQSERGITAAINSVSSGGALATEIARQVNSPSNNYSAKTLDSELSGIPKILLNDTAWASSGMTGSDVTDTVSDIKVRYVIDRLCTGPGVSSVSTCAISALGEDKSGTIWINRAGGASLPVYRISIRVTGPRNTQTFVQSAISL